MRGQGLGARDRTIPKRVGRTLGGVGGVGGVADHPHAGGENGLL